MATRWRILTLVLASTLVVAACGGSGDEEGSAPSADRPSTSTSTTTLPPPDATTTSASPTTTVPAGPMCTDRPEVDDGPIGRAIATVQRPDLAISLGQVRAGAEGDGTVEVAVSLCAATWSEEALRHEATAIARAIAALPEASTVTRLTVEAYAAGDPAASFGFVLASDFRRRDWSMDPAALDASWELALS